MERSTVMRDERIESFLWWEWDHLYMSGWDIVPWAYDHHGMGLVVAYLAHLGYNLLHLGSMLRVILLTIPHMFIPNLLPYRAERVLMGAAISVEERQKVRKFKEKGWGEETNAVQR